VRCQASDHATTLPRSEKDPIMTTERFSPPHLTRRFVLTTAAAGAVTALAGCVPDMPVSLSPSSAANLEFGLWAGVPGARFGQAVNRAVGPRRIRGPRQWTHPITGKRLTIYVRTKWERTGTKTSYYTLRADGTALARVFDKRPGKPDRYFTDDAFMPVGPWRSGMTKSYRMTEHSRGKARRYTVSIQVTRSSFTHKGHPGSMEYIWTQREASGTKTAQLRYVYSPGLGLVDVKNLMK
jgi:hypothetical protein